MQLFYTYKCQVSVYTTVLYIRYIMRMCQVCSGYIYGVDQVCIGYAQGLHGMFEVCILTHCIDGK